MAKKAKKHHLYRYRVYRRFEKKLNFVRSFDFKFESVFANDITLIIAFLKGGLKRVILLRLRFIIISVL